jgi:nucleoid-associated protein YgaU
MRDRRAGLLAPRPPAIVVLALLVVALGVAACLPASIRPPAPPTPTPTPIPSAPPTPTPTPGPPTPTPGPSFALYTVKNGDTLTSIARRFKTDGRSIAYWNRDTYPGLDPESAGYRPDAIKVGWVLKILRGQAYVPPPDDGETGEQSTPTPDDANDFESAPSPSGAQASPG